MEWYILANCFSLYLDVIVNDALRLLTMCDFHFPPTVFVDRTTLQDQAYKMLEEAQEVVDETIRLPVDFFKVAVETWDSILAAETQMRKLAYHHGVDIEEAYREVLRKNNAPGREYFVKEVQK